MRINHNIASLNTHRQLTGNTASASKSLEKLSSGFRINRAGDDAAGLAISEKMRAQIRGLDMAAKNAQDGISLIQTAEGALAETHSILQRIRELADQSANGTNTDDDRKALQDEVKQLKDEIDRIGNTTEFNTKKLLNGALKSDALSVGTNITNGAQVLEQTFATATSVRSGTMAAGDYSTVDFTTDPKETITIDQTSIEIDWASKLTDAEKALIDANYSGTAMTTSQASQIREAIERVVNQSIDEHNAAHGSNIGHIDVYANASGVLVMKSSLAGEDSQINISSNAGAVLSTYMTSGAAVSATGDDLLKEAFASGSTIAFEINGVKLQTSGITGSGAAAGDDADTLAANIQAALRAAVQAYTSGAGLTDGEEGYIDHNKIFVEASNGRISVKSEDGAISFIEQEGYQTLEDLGLTTAQTEASGSGGMTFQIGANRGQTIQFGIGDMRAASLGIANVDISTKTGASLALDSLDKAIKSVSSERAKLGAVQNRLEHTINNLGTASENLTAAESRIRDVDMAKEMMDFTKSNILSQAAQAMLAQANQQPQGVLQLLR
ncbi:MAG TPA: flagellin [Paenibacillus sp.]|nr:flagellin [Paenibacillus sp.]